MPRRKIAKFQYTDILTANAGVCCVCKIRGMGVNIHHIDHNPSNNDSANLAVLCVKDHDAHHRPNQYTVLNHTNLQANEILQFKLEWERFIAEARKLSPSILAVINIYGTNDNIHSLRLLYQWPDGKIIFERLFHLLDGPVEQWVDSALEDVQWLGQNIKMVLVDSLLSVDHCPNCAKGLANTIDENVAVRLTSPDWNKQSVGSVYINPCQPSLAVTIFYRGKTLASASLHRCGDHLHFTCNNYEERIFIKGHRKISSQAKSIVKKYLSDWAPGVLLYGTGNPDVPLLIPKMTLPISWQQPSV